MTFQVRIDPNDDTRLQGQVDWDAIECLPEAPATSRKDEPTWFKATSGWKNFGPPATGRPITDHRLEILIPVKSQKFEFHYNQVNNDQPQLLNPGEFVRSCSYKLIEKSDCHTCTMKLVTEFQGIKVKATKKREVPTSKYKITDLVCP